MVLQNRKVTVTDATQWKGYGHWGYKIERSWSLVLHNGKVVVTGVTKWTGYSHWCYTMERAYLRKGVL